MTSRSAESGVRPRPGEVAIGLGSNLGDPVAQLARARERLGEFVTDLRASRVHETEPLGPPQPRFQNQVVVGRTELAPRDLLLRLHQIEVDLGRVREERWGPRTIDLDLLVHGFTRESGDVELPHPGIAERSFVLDPWSEIASEWVVVGAGPAGAEATVAELRAALDARTLSGDAT